VTTLALSARRHAVELGHGTKRALVAWMAIVLFTGALTLIFGWQEHGAITPVTNLLLWPGSVLPILVLSALAMRGGVIVGAACTAFVGVTCAVVVLALPDAKLPVGPAYRQHYIIEAIGTSAVVGLVIGAVGVGLRRAWLAIARSRQPDSGFSMLGMVAASGADVSPRVKSVFHGSVAECLQQAYADARQAAWNGYVPVSQHWGDGEDPELTVIYALDPAAAGAITGLPVASRPIPAPGWSYVGFWRRVAALLIDSFLLTVLLWASLLIVLPRLAGGDFGAAFGSGAYVVDPTTHQITITPAGAAALRRMVGLILWLELTFVVGWALYQVLFWWRFGATLGQRALGIQIRRLRDGTRPTLWTAFLRAIGYLISGWALGIGFFWVAFDARKQGWHDHIAGTVAVRRVG
jgi:uncharacterized RDD family membrane protein YckC